MAIRKVLSINDEEGKLLLTTPTKQVDPNTIMDSSVQSLIYDMIDTVKSQPALGLSANQIGAKLQIAVITRKREPMVLINPIVVKERGTHLYKREACLSVSGMCTTRRSRRVWVEALDSHGLRVQFKGVSGRLAHVLQHEIGHLHGRIFTEFKEEESDALGTS